MSAKVQEALDVAVEALKKAAARENKVTPVSTGTSWTTEQDTELKKLFAKNWTVKQLAERYDRTTGAIKSRLARMGVTQ